MEDLHWKPQENNDQLKKPLRILSVETNCCLPIARTPAEIWFEAYTNIMRSFFKSYEIMMGFRT